jgi:hypothetical protein
MVSDAGERSAPRLKRAVLRGLVSTLIRYWVSARACLIGARVHATVTGSARPHVRKRSRCERASLELKFGDANNVAR